MSQWDKLISRIKNLSKNLRYDELKTQRALLLKTFHPDNKLVESADYTQKINHAYQLLLDLLNKA